MGQHKMDKDFKIKLSQREITPTANAWDRLDAMLTVAEQKKPKKDFGWLYIAASVVGFLLLGTVYFNSIPELNDVKREGNNDIVLQNNNSGKTQETTAEKILPTATDSQSIAAATPIITKSSTTSTRASANWRSNHQSKNESIITRAAGELAVGNQNQSTSNPVQTINKIPNQSELIADNQTNKAIKTEQAVTSAKVDELLANAGTGQKSEKSTVKVNAKSLLSQVDGEVNQSFREKVIHKIGRNYQEVAQAVSNRNVQQ